MDTGTFHKPPLALVVVPFGEAYAGVVISVLEEMGLNSRLHHDAGSALEAVEYDEPALVVHGWNLPDMDAVTFHGAVRQRAGRRRVPTIAIAPDMEAASRIADDAPGLSDTLVRPLRRAELAERLSRAMGESTRSDGRSTPASSTPKESTMKRGVPELRLRVVGLGEWGTRAAEILDRQGVPSSAIDVPGAIEHSSLPEERRHAVVTSGDHDTAARELAADPTLAEALRGGDETDLFVVVANLGVGVGSLAATVLTRLAAVAPRAGRHVIARLAGVRSSPDERALGLVALNTILEAPPTGIFLVSSADGPMVSDDDADPSAPLYRLLELWSLVTGAGPEAVQPLRGAALSRFLATPGFVGWRETPLTSDDITPDGRGWLELVTPPPWQPSGFAWGEAQEVLTLGRLPWAWLQGGGRRLFEGLVRTAWDEAAPCAVVPGLYAGDPASVVVVSAGMPFPRGILALRDSIVADRERLDEKRRKAVMQIPLDDDILPSSFEVLPAPMDQEMTVRDAPQPAEEEAAALLADEDDAAALLEEEVAAAIPQPTLGEVTEPAPPWKRPRTEPMFSPVREEETAAAEIELPKMEPGPMPLAYESALALVRRILSADDLRAEVDLGEVRYVLYDLLELLREEPQALLPEVFRPEVDEYFERHHVNVAVLAILTGDLMRGSLSEVIDLGTAALLHDVGMVPTREAWDAGVRVPPKVFEQAIRPHPELGYRRIQELTGVSGSVARMILEEHERMDGSGYPQGLAGAAIDPGARVLGACDSLEAMTHPRPYRDHLSPGEALARLQVLGQYTLDPKVVQALAGELQELFRRRAPESERR